MGSMINMINVMLCGLLAIGSAAYVDASKAKPHVLFVVADDFGFNDIALRDNETTNQGVPLTPTLNQLAHDGILLDNYYVQPSCSPSRACFMSGRYPLHTGINNWLPNVAVGLPLDEVTLADLFKENGYSTHAVGKWHLGFYNWESTPTFRGFDSFYGFYEGSEDYFKHTTSAFDLHREPSPRCGKGCSQLPWDDVGTYSAFLFTTEVENIIKANQGGDPLFIYLAYQSVHAPAQAPQRYIDLFNESLSGDAYNQRRTFAGMVHCMDEGLGNITSLLKAQGMWTAENPSVIVFTDENGAPTDACAQIGGNNLPHRGGKCSIWEGGTKGVSIVASPLLQKTGYTYHGLAHGVDWLPTLITGVLGASTSSTKPLDGHNIWNALLNDDPSLSTRTDIYYGITDSADGNYGPALRLANGSKIIIGGWGGGKGNYKYLNNTYINGPIPNSISSTRGIDTLLFGGPVANCSFNVTSQRCCPGDVLKHVDNINSTSTCCSECQSTPGCVAFTMNIGESTCYLKASAKYATVGNCDCGHRGALPPLGPSPSPSPGPGPNKSKVLLYNVETDVGERFEMSAGRSDIVASLMAMVDEHEKTGVPQATGNKSCGPAKQSQDNSTAGQGRMYWGPWC